MKKTEFYYLFSNYPKQLNEYQYKKRFQKMDYKRLLI